MAMRINGLPLPPGVTGLKDFLRKAYEGRMNQDLGMLASAAYNHPSNEDARMDAFINMLNYNPAEEINMDSPYADSAVIAANNYITHGNQIGNEISNADISSQIYDFPTLQASYNAEGGYGLPLWFAKMKGFIK